MFITNSNVIVIAMHLSKAFHTVRHVTLLKKMANLDLPDHVFNWLVNFFSERQQCTAYKDTASVLQPANNLSQYRSWIRSWSSYS